MSSLPAVPPPRVTVPGEVMATGRLSPFLAQTAAAQGPIFAIVPTSGPFVGRDVVYMVGPEASRFVGLTHREYFSNDRGWTPALGGPPYKGLVNMDEPEHTRHRALIGQAFTASSLQRWMPAMTRVIAACTSGWARRREVDLIAEARRIAFDIAAATLLEVETDPDLVFLRDRFYALFHAPAPPGRGGEAARARLRGELKERLLRLVSAARERGTRTEALLDIVAHARDERGEALSDGQIAAHLELLLVAGHETTTHLAAWSLYLLATNPAYAARVDEELASVIGPPDAPMSAAAMHRLPLLTNAIRETGRLHPPVMFLPRVAVRAFEFEGYAVPAGTPVMVAVAAGHRLPTAFAEPDRFDPDRFAPPREEDKRQSWALTTFGGGPRACLGSQFAQAEVKALVAHVRRRYRLIPVPHRPIVHVDALVECLPAGIHVRVEALDTARVPVRVGEAAEEGAHESSPDSNWHAW